MDKDIEKLLSSMDPKGPTLALTISEGISEIQMDETGNRFGLQCQQYIWAFNPATETTVTRENASDAILATCDGFYHEMNSMLLADQRVQAKMDFEQHPVYDVLKDTLGTIIDEIILDGGAYSNLSTVLPDAHEGDERKLRATLNNVPMLSIIIYVHCDLADRDRLTIGYGLVLQWVTPTDDEQMVVNKHVHLADAQYCLI